MIKKLALGVVTLGLLFPASSGWTCIGIGDSCDVKDMTSIEYGYDIKVDVDVCIDAGNLQGGLVMIFGVQGLLFYKMVEEMRPE